LDLRKLLTQDPPAEAGNGQGSSGSWEVVASGGARASGSRGSATASRVYFKWDSQPGGWWCELPPVRENETILKMTALCGHSEDGDFVRFIEDGHETFAHSGKNLRGVFTMVAGKSGRFHRLDSFEGLNEEEIQNALKLFPFWVSQVGPRELVFIAILGVYGDDLDIILQELGDLKVPQVPPKSRDVKALAAVGVTPAEGQRAIWVTHSTTDVAYASLPWSENLGRW